VTPVPPLNLLTPPGAPTWTEAIRRGHVKRADLLELISRVRMTVARELQYQTFLANPNVIGKAHGVYVYEPAMKTAARPPAASPGSDGNSPWLTVLIAALAVVGATGLVVLWANS
jgi:hypothetical protein